MADKIKEEIAIWHTGWVGGCNFNLIPYKTIINFIGKNRINEDLPKQSFLFVFILVVIRIVINVRIATSLMTLSAIFTKRLNPSLERRLSRWAMFWQKSLARVDESTSKAWKSDRPFWKWSYCIYFWDTCTEVHLFTSNVDLLASIHYCRRLPILEHVRPLFCSSLQILCWCRTKSINFWI